MTRNRIAAVVALGIGLGSVSSARAGDWRIPIMSSSHATPVQRLNREGVEAIRKHDYDKAKSLFYRAYLFDPDDPFTLNNLGYISELEGRAVQAERFYELAAQQQTGATIDIASSKKVQGESIEKFVNGIQDPMMQVNRGNVQALNLLRKGRAAEAETVLEQTLRQDPHNAFTLNNLGVAKEMQGDYEAALKYYNAAARTHSKAPVIVSVDTAVQGRPVSEIAAESAKRLKRSMEGVETLDQRVARLNLRGVSAVNRNDWKDARTFFLQAYRLDPNNAFSLNNLGFLAERDGDEETAQDFYQRARTAENAGAKVGLATRTSAEGKSLSSVADENDGRADSRMEEEHEALRRQTGPIRLHRRDGSIVEPVAPQPPPSSQVPNPAQTTPSPQP